MRPFGILLCEGKPGSSVGSGVEESTQTEEPLQELQRELWKAWGRFQDTPLTLTS